MVSAICQLILKGLEKNRPTSGRLVFVCFLVELKTQKRRFEINWPLTLASVWLNFGQLHFLQQKTGQQTCWNAKAMWRSVIGQNLVILSYACMLVLQKKIKCYFQSRTWHFASFKTVIQIKLAFCFTQNLKFMFLGFVSVCFLIFLFW